MPSHQLLPKMRGRFHISCNDLENALTEGIGLNVLAIGKSLVNQAWDY